MWGRAGGVKSVTRWGEESSSSSHYVAAGPASISCLMEVGGGWKVGSMAGSQGRVDVRLACSSKGETEDGARVFAWVEGRRQPLHVQS